MAERDSFASDGTSAAPDGVRLLDNPHLGRQLFGYSRSRTNALLERAASMIEDLASGLVSWQEACEAASARLDAAESELARTRIELAKQHESEAAVAEALVTAHREAAAIVGRGRSEATELLVSAQAQASELDAEAGHVIEQAEIRAQALVERAAGEVEHLYAEAERLRARIARERELWASSLRRALTTFGSDDAPPAAILEHGLGGALQANIGAAIDGTDAVAGVRGARTLES